MQNDKTEKIIDVVVQIGNEKWQKHEDGSSTTELNGKKIKLQYAYSGMRPSIIIDGLDFFDKEGADKIWGLYIRLCDYFNPPKQAAIESSIDSVYNELIGDK